MTYKTTIIRSSFWYHESKKTVKFIIDGLSRNEINKITTDENTYQVNTISRSKNIANTTYNRMSIYPIVLLEKFIETDVSTAKIMVLMSIMATDKLFYEFMNEVYKEKKLLKYEKLTKKDSDIFMNRKRIENDQIEKWSDNVINRIKSTYFSILRDSGLLTNDYIIKEIYIDYDIQKSLIDMGFQNLIEILL